MLGQAMKKILFNPLVFFVSLIVGLFAAAIVWESTKPLPDFQIAPVVLEEERFEELQLEPPTGQAYDQARFDEITNTLKWIIENKKDKDSDIFAPFDRVSNLLSLENVPWDDISDKNSRNSQLRMYHFRGFCLFLYLERRISGRNPEQFSAEDLRKKGISYVCDLPSVQIDGLNDPQERLRRHQKEIAESVRSDFEELQKQEKDKKLQR